MALASIQVVATTAFATVGATHNGWVFYHGGDQLWYSAYASLLGQFWLPPADVGFGWSLLLAPVTWFTGPSFVQLLPFVVPLNVLVLGSVALFCVYDLASRIAGRLFGYWAAVLWVVAPYVSIQLWIDRYHERFTDVVLPMSLGLTLLADYPSMVALLIAAVLALRAVEARSSTYAVSVGLVVGFAVVMKPSNSIFLVAVGLAYVVGRCWRLSLTTAGAMVPALLALSIWKQRGVGQLPLFANPGSHQVAGPAVVGGDSWFQRFVPLDWSHLWQQVEYLHEFFRVPVLAEALPVLGLVTLLLLRRTIVASLLLGWLGAFAIVKGSSPVADLQSGSFFRLLMPAWPAYLLLCAAATVLPWAVMRRVSTPSRSLHRDRLTRPLIVVTAAVTGIALIVVSFARPLDGSRLAVLDSDDRLTSVEPAIRLAVTRANAVNELRWTEPRYETTPYHIVYRSDPGASTTTCTRRGVEQCTLTMVGVAVTRGTRYDDSEGAPGATYRIGIGSSFDGDPTQGDVFVVSRPSRAPG